MSFLLKIRLSLATLILINAAATYAIPISTIEMTSIDLISKSRSGRSTFDYTYRATLKNNGVTVNNLTGVVSSNTLAVKVIDGLVNISELHYNDTITTIDTITLRIDRKIPFDPSSLTWVFDGEIINGNTPPTDDNESLSSGIVTTVLKEGVLYPVGTDVVLTVNDAQFSTKSGEVTLLHNENLVKTLTVNSDSIIAPNLLVDGVNRIVLYANDSNKNQLVFEITLWSGGNSAFISILNIQGASTTANLKLRLADDETVGFDAIAEGGIYNAANLPSRTVIIEATTPLNEFGSGALIGGMDSEITITAIGVGEPSDVDNNDLSQGLLGWEINGNGTVVITPEAN